MTQALELAKQGDPKAIAALMSRHLTPQGISVKVANCEARLQVLLDGIDTPDQTQMSGFISNGIRNLGLPDVALLEIFAKRTGEDQLAWVSAYSHIDGDWQATEPEADAVFGEGNLVVRCQEGDVDALQQFTSSAVEMLLSQLDREDTDHDISIKTAVNLDEAGLLTVTIETQQFLDGPAFAADLGKCLNEVASLRIKELALYKRKTATAQPFLIKQMTLVPQR